MIICTSDAIICEPKMIGGVSSIIVCGREMVLCSMTMIADAAQIIVPEVEKTESLTELIAEEMEILVSPSSTIADDMEMIVKETQLIGTTVLSKGRREWRQPHLCLMGSNQRVWFGLSSSLSCRPIEHAPFHF